MAGEWIPVDVTLGTKPEIQELMDLTGQSVEVVTYRLIQLWGWASLNTADGTVRATKAMIARICGGDVQFWEAVESVGWIRFGDGTAEIPGWGRRFSAGAKARSLNAERCARYRHGRDTRERVANVSRGEERRGQNPPPPPREETEQQQPEPEPAAWQRLLEAWNRGRGEQWRSPSSPPEAARRLAEAGWIDRAEQAIGMLSQCRYFTEPVTLTQFCRSGFADRVLGGQYNSPKKPKTPRGSDERPPPREWDGETRERYLATLRRLETNDGGGT